jgi:hypothetical protein
LDEAEFKLHRRVAHELEIGVQDRGWWVWIELLPKNGAPAEISLDGLAGQAAAWLSSLDIEPERNERPEMVWSADGLDVRLHALRRSPNNRTQQPLVGNPVPAFAFFPGAERTGGRA